MTHPQAWPSKQPEAVRPLTFECLRIGRADTVFLAVAGELDIATAPQLDRVLRDTEAVASQIVLDLGGLEFVASCGAHLLMKADTRIRRAGGRLRIERAPEGLRRILALLCATAELPGDVLPKTSTYRSRLKRRSAASFPHRPGPGSAGHASNPGHRTSRTR